MSATRIVAVDDDRRILRSLARACAAVGGEVHPVLAAEDFAATFQAVAPSLVFLDLNMRRIDGVELLRFIASQDTPASVVVTSGVEESLLRAAHALGVSLGIDMLEPIRKPLAVADVRRRLEMLHERRERTVLAEIEPAALAEALSGGLLDVSYQPMVDLGSGEVVCAEALARLRRAPAPTAHGAVGPTVGPIAAQALPEQFVGVAERCGLIDALTFGVLERALADHRTWTRSGADVRLSINVSPLLLTDASLADRIEATLERHGTAPDRLVVEVTETRVPDDRLSMAQTLSRLRLKGVHLALDDFGTGFCSLGQLYEFPFETLKLDKRFAMHAEHSERAAAMIRSSLELARSIGLDVVAEGVQSEEVLRWLGRMGCDMGQGYHIGRPMPAAAFRAWLEHASRTAPRFCVGLQLDRLGTSF